MSEQEAKPPRQPGERHPDADKVVKARKSLDAECYAEYKRLERERAIRLAVAETPEMSEEDSAYVAKLRAKSARLDMVISPLEKAEILALCEMQGTSVSAYLLQLHRHAANHFKVTAEPKARDAFNWISEQHFSRVTGDRVLSQLDAELMNAVIPESNTEA